MALRDKVVCEYNIVQEGMGWLEDEELRTPFLSNFAGTRDRLSIDWGQNSARWVGQGEHTGLQFYSPGGSAVAQLNTLVAPNHVGERLGNNVTKMSCAFMVEKVRGATTGSSVLFGMAEGNTNQQLVISVDKDGYPSVTFGDSATITFFTSMNDSLKSIYHLNIDLSQNGLPQQFQMWRDGINVPHRNTPQVVSTIYPAHFYQPELKMTLGNSALANRQISGTVYYMLIAEGNFTDDDIREIDGLHSVLDREFPPVVLPPNRLEDEKIIHEWLFHHEWDPESGSHRGVQWQREWMQLVGEEEPLDGMDSLEVFYAAIDGSWGDVGWYVNDNPGGTHPDDHLFRMVEPAQLFQNNSAFMRGNLSNTSSLPGRLGPNCSQFALLFAGYKWYGTGDGGRIYQLGTGLGEGQISLMIIQPTFGTHQLHFRVGWEDSDGPYDWGTWYEFPSGFDRDGFHIISAHFNTAYGNAADRMVVAMDGERLPVVNSPPPVYPPQNATINATGQNLTRNLSVGNRGLGDRATGLDIMYYVMLDEEFDPSFYANSLLPRLRISTAESPFMEITTPDYPDREHQVGEDVGTIWLWWGWQASRAPSFWSTLEVINLPPGLVADEVGNVTGVPTQAGTYVVETIHRTRFLTQTTPGPDFTWTILTTGPEPPDYDDQLDGKGVPIEPVDLSEGWTDHNPDAFSATGIPTGLDMTVQGVVTGTPTTEGNYTVTVTNIGDAGPVEAPPFNWEIVVVPVPPEYDDRIGYVGEEVTLDLSEGWEDFVPGMFTADGLPTGLAMDSDGMVTGTHTDDGTFSVTVSNEGVLGVETSQPFSWLVEPVPIPPVYVDRIDLLDEDIGAVDLSTGWVDADPDGFTVQSLPLGLEMSDQGIVTGTPVGSHDTHYDVVVLNTNQALTVAADPFEWRFGYEPVPPTYMDRQDTVGETIDEDFSEGWTFYHLAGFDAVGLPSDLTMDPDGQVTGTLDDADTHLVIVTNTNQFGSASAAPFDWDVYDQPTPPDYDDLSSPRLEPVSVDLSLGWTAAEPGGFRATGLPTGLSMNGNGLVTGTPSVAQTTTVTVINDYPAGSVTAETFEWEIYPVPIAPDYSDLIDWVGASIQLSIAAGWFDHDPQGFSESGLPDGLTMSAGGGVTGAGTTAGVSQVTISNTNAGVTTDADPFSWTMVAVPIPPDYADQANRTDDVINLDLSAGWTDAEPNGFSATGLPPGLTMANDGTVTGQGTIDGSWQVTVYNATQAGSVAAQPFTWSMRFPPDTPIPPDYPDRASLEGVQTGANLAAGWIDAEPFGFTVDQLPDGLTMTTFGIVTGTPTTLQTVTVTVSNTYEDGTVSAEPFDWVIEERPPPEDTGAHRNQITISKSYTF